MNGLKIIEKEVTDSFLCDGKLLKIGNSKFFADIRSVRYISFFYNASRPGHWP